MTALSQICEVPCYQSYCVLNCELGFTKFFERQKHCSRFVKCLSSTEVYRVLKCRRGFAENFCGMTALSQICEVPCYQGLLCFEL